MSGNKPLEADTARAMGSGNLPVLATPRLAALMENAAFEAVAPILDTETGYRSQYLQQSFLIQL